MAAQSQVKRIALLGNDALFREKTETAASQLNYEIVALDTLSAALDWLAQQNAGLIICDTRLGDTDALEALTEIRRTAPQCEVILSTRPGESGLAVQALRAGATDVVEQPIATGDLQAALERTRRHRSLSAEQEDLTGRLNTLSQALAARTAGETVMVGQSEPMRRVAQEIVSVADTNATVLVLGESGTGKEVIANAIHQTSSRRKRPCLAVNCSSISDNLFEAEMFGHRRGAFTGAVDSRTGYVEAAEGGTLFMDEIGDLPIGSQAKILRLLEQRSYVRVGDPIERAADVRIVAATNQPLEDLIAEKSFREDLYYRLSVCTIQLPPLRDRREDIPLLAMYFVLHFAAELGKDIDGLDDEAMEHLTTYAFPGNVRELRNIIESSLIRCPHDGQLSMDDLPIHIPSTAAAPTQRSWPFDSFRFEDVERRLYKAALMETDNNVSAAARLMEMERSKLRRRLRALRLD